MSPACLLGDYIPSTRRERGCSFGVSGGCRACVPRGREVLELLPQSSGIGVLCWMTLGKRLCTSISSSVKEGLYLRPKVVVRVE